VLLHLRTIGARLGLEKIMLAVGILLIVLGGSMLTSNVALFADATSYQPKSFTELYFAQPDALPKVMHTDVVYTAPFTIVNRTSARQTYHYTITVQTESAIAVQPPVAITLMPGEAVTKNALLKAPVPDQPLLVSINLKGTDQVIRFYAAP
jgi:hypothetical protein